METLTAQFEEALARVEVSGARRARAQAAHSEVREVLEGNAALNSWGIDTVLIGSYARHTSIHPGKDVDVFSKLTNLDTSASPTSVFNAMRVVLVDHYGDRAEPQARSIKILFDDDDGFGVDAVPAVHQGNRWAIPNRDVSTWEGAASEQWVETDPEMLTSLTTRQNSRFEIGGRGAYVPIVKLVRQTRRFHLGDKKPGGLYFELLIYWLFDEGIAAASWAHLFALALRGLHRRLTQAGAQPLIDPVLERPFEPHPDDAEVINAADCFGELASRAESALVAEECAAAVLWRSILGTNERGHVFPLPDGCDEKGRRISPIESVTSRGSREASSFGTSRDV